MFVVYRAMFAMTVSTKSDRDIIQSFLVSLVNQILTEHGIQRYVGKEPVWITWSWIDGSKDIAVYGSRATIDFTSLADRTTFLNDFRPNVISAVASHPEINWWKDNSGKSNVLQLTEYEDFDYSEEVLF